MTDPTGYAPAGPLDNAPEGGFVSPLERSALICDALGPIRLGAYDRRIINWLADQDDPTCRTIVSLIRRARSYEAS